jgi:2-dehydro-3-deoxyphosphogluconate aldolase/(4S)-4-hydroxy-2-oxoglutarate aldolase
MDLFAYKILPLVVINDAGDAKPLADALIAGGLPIVEVAFRTEAAAESIAIMSEIEGLTVGAGTVLKPAQVELAVEAGASFLVSPGVREDVVREAQLAGKPILPGVVTPGEIMAVQYLGIDTVQFFPADVFGGVSAIASLSSAFPTTTFIPSGGIEQHNLAEYLSLPCVPAVECSWVVPMELIDAQDFRAISALCRQALTLGAC